MKLRPIHPHTLAWLSHAVNGAMVLGIAVGVAVAREGLTLCPS